MKKIELFIMPYARDNEVKTRLIVDENKIYSKDNRLTNLVVYQPMRKWLTPYKKKLFVWDGLLEEVIEEFNDRSIHFIFYGLKSDFALFRKSILQQQMNLNRNGGTVDVVLDTVDKWNFKEEIKELTEVLNDLCIEADNWGEDDIIKEIDCLKSEISSCYAVLNCEFTSAGDEIKRSLEESNLVIKSDSQLTVIPVDKNASVSALRDFITQSAAEDDKNRKYLVINTSMQENDALSDTVISLYSDNCSDIRYIENAGEDYIPEIEKLYYYSILPAALEKAYEILHMFPDHKTNNYLIDIADRMDSVFFSSRK